MLGKCLELFSKFTQIVTNAIQSWAKVAMGLISD